MATAVVTANDTGSPGSDKNASDLPAPADLPSDTSQPQPSFSSVAPPPPPDPKDYISDARKDKAPITVDAFFPGKKVTAGDRVHAKGATNRTNSCAATTQGALGSILTSNGCDQVIRATYSNNGVAVTVGLAVFGTEAEAKKAAQQASGGIASLSGAGVPTFCRAGCRLPPHRQLLRALRLLHRRRLHQRQERHDREQGRVRGGRRPDGVHVPSDPPPRRGTGIGSGRDSHRLTPRHRSPHAPVPSLPRPEDPPPCV